MHPQRNWRDLIKPKGLEIEARNLTPTYGKFVAEPLERGFGTTVAKCHSTVNPPIGALSRVASKGRPSSGLELGEYRVPVLQSRVFQANASCVSLSVPLEVGDSHAER